MTSDRPGRPDARYAVAGARTCAMVAVISHKDNRLAPLDI